MLLYSLLLFAEDAVDKAADDKGPGGLSFFFPIILMFVVFYLLIIVPGRKERANRQNMLGALKKNDKIITQGGIVGVVTSLKEGTDEMVIKSEDTKLLVLKSSVARVISEGEKETPKEPPKETTTAVKPA